MHGILPDFMYWLSFSILLFSVGITVTEKSLFLQIFSWGLSLSSALKE